MAEPGKLLVYVDTNVVIEATRTKCWRAILKNNEIHTVTAVRDEAGRGKGRPGYISVDMSEFDSHVTVHAVTNAMILQAAAKAKNLFRLDRGERDLLAWVSTQPTTGLILTTADSAAVMAACALSLDENLRSLEELAKNCGETPELNEWFTMKWLSSKKTAFLLNNLE